jgi:hypothetical protein
VTPERKAYLLSVSQYPQLTANESAVARAWLVQHADEYDDVDFSVRLGATVDRLPDWSDATWRQAQILSQKRIDMIAYKGTEVTIIEVKLRVSLAALGQLLGYGTLWRVEHPESTAVHLLAIGNSALVDAHDILTAHSVNIELFPDVAITVLPKA